VQKSLHRPEYLPRFPTRVGRLAVITALLTAVFGHCARAATAEKNSPSAIGSGESSSGSKSRVLLLGQGPDGHPWSTHEYQDGLRVLALCLNRTPALTVIAANADPPWNNGPELIDSADGVVLYLSEGAKWIGENPARRAAFERLAARGGGLVCLHWAMGCRDSRYVAGFVRLFGGCHGGTDRKYRVVKVQTSVADAMHPIASGLSPFEVEDEFYYRLKFPAAKSSVIPILQVPIDGKAETVAWAWERPDGGRSFGFSGLHFHKNWTLPAYRRLAVQGILWTSKRPIPSAGVDINLSETDLTLRRPRPQKSR
jgi:type 1 glutamine amidotransferase